MADTRQCSSCGGWLLADTPGGQCPRCLLELAAEAGQLRTQASYLSDRQQQFGDYELLELLGSGGMGKVYRARQRSLNRIVALKLIHAGRFAGPEEVARFQREAEAAASLDHPNIAQIYEVGQHDNQHYFTMKLIEGRTLSQWQSNCRARDKKWCRSAAKLILVVAAALHHAHKRGVMHRDLKPANILVDKAGEPCIVDFGLAHLVERNLNHGPPDNLGGTLGYMAPEQLAGSLKDLTTAVDIYSLGCILYELLTARLPHEVKSLAEAIRVVAVDEPASPHIFNHCVDSDLSSVCLKCLRKEPEQRYDSAAGLVDDLERWERREPVASRPIGRLGRIGKWGRRHPLTAGIPLVLLCGAGAVLAIGYFRSALQNTRYVPPPKVLSVDPLVAAAGSTVTISGADFSTSRAGNMVFFPGGIRAEVKDASSNRLNVIAPAGTKYGSITINTRHRTAYSPKPFVATFPGSDDFGPQSFEPKITIPLPFWIGWVLLEDLDGDGKLDILTAPYERGSVSIFRNVSIKGRLDTNSFATRIDLPQKYAANLPGVGDLTGDGRLDLVMPAYQRETRVAQNVGRPGTLDVASFRLSGSTDGIGSASFVRDLDGDGRPDFATFALWAPGVQIFQNINRSRRLQASQFVSATALSAGLLCGGGCAICEDVDGDGKPEVVAGLENKVLIYQNTSSPGKLNEFSFAPAVEFAALTALEVRVGINSVLAGDIDGDGKVDLVVVAYSEGIVAVFLNTSTVGRIDGNSFATPVHFSCSATNTGRAALGDVNGDGKLDIVVPNEGESSVSVFINRSVPGKLNFAPRVTFPTEPSPLHVAIGDLDGDGLPEIITANYSGSISILRHILRTSSPAHRHEQDR